MRILPLYPYARALQALADIGRPELRLLAIRAVRNELRAQRDGLGIARTIQQARLQPAREAAPCAT